MKKESVAEGVKEEEKRHESVRVSLQQDILYRTERYWWDQNLLNFLWAAKIAGEEGLRRPATVVGTENAGQQSPAASMFPKCEGRQEHQKLSDSPEIIDINNRILQVSLVQGLLMYLTCLTMPLTYILGPCPSKSCL